MQVESNSSTTNEPINSKKTSNVAKNAIGWMQQIISDTVKDITDFSAMLSEQSSANQPEKKDSEPAKHSEPKPLETKPVTVLKDVNVSAELILKQITTPEQKEPIYKDNKAEKNEEVVAKDSDKVDAAAPKDTEVEEVKDERQSGEETETKDSSDEQPETAAIEMLAAQIQKIVAPQAEEVIAEDAADGVAEVKFKAEVVSDEALPIKVETAPVKAEEIPEEVRKELADFAKKSIQKPVAQEVKPQTAQVETKVKAEESVDFSIAPEASTVTPDLGQATVQARATSAVSASTQLQATNTSLSQTFMNTWVAHASQGASEGQGSRAIEGAAGAKLGSNFGSKVGQENLQNSAAMAKGSEAIAVGDKSLSFSIQGEQGQKSEATKSSKPLTRGQSLATLEKVEAALQKAAESKDGTLISLRLDPPSLGSVKVDVSLREGQLHARISADSAQVLQLLRERAPDLQVTLRKLGLDVDKVSVSVNSGDQGSTFNDSEGNRGGNNSKGGNNFSELADSAASQESAQNLDHWIA